MRRVLGVLILALATTTGLWAFIYPFFFPPEQSDGMVVAHGADAPFFFLLLLLLCLTVIIANLETRRMNSKMVAVLGMLTAITAVLRLIPGPAGFSAVFFLPILCGYVYGADFGFLLGSLSLLVSAFITSGVGPWLPFQMFAAGWMGLSSAWLPDISRLGARVEVLVLAAWGAFLGFTYGAIMNLWFWPYLIAPGQEEMTWSPSLGLVQTLVRYGVFYLTTSLWWDGGRAIGNFALIALVGVPLLRLLRRFHRVFHFEAASRRRAPKGCG
jgi:energy-coupling factor transport system substrate-specific component